MRNFFAVDAAGGIVMFFAAALALMLANTPPHDSYHAFIHAPLLAGINLHTIVSDGLMPIFFLFVGLELKKEMTEGALSTPRQRLLPLIAALGGIALPAAIYLFLTHDYPELRNGWAIPTATDIAFALCIVSLVGKRVPPAAKIFLLAIAIYDDLAAILIIALFYSSPNLTMLAPAALTALAMFALHCKGRGNPWLVIPLGAILGVLLYKAGIHPTVAGMLTGLAIQRDAISILIKRLHPWVAFGILPLFAFASAGIDIGSFSLDNLSSPLPLAIITGLFLGKQLGIFGATYAAVKLRLAPMPADTSARTLYAIAIVAGIGFTMSLFIGQLAFTDPAQQDLLRAGVLAGSLISAVTGFLLLKQTKA